MSKSLTFWKAVSTIWVDGLINVLMYRNQMGITHRMVALLQSLFSQPLPELGLVDCFGLLRSDGKVTTFDSEIESGRRVLNEVQSDLGVSFFLQVADNALTDEVAGADDLENLVVVLANESELEAVLRRVDGDGSRLGRSVEAVNCGSLHSREVDGLLKGLDDTIVTEWMKRDVG